MAGFRKMKPDRLHLPGEKSGNNLGTKPILFQVTKRLSA
jgi:hypothetical protein